MKFLSNVLLKAGLIVEGTTDLQGTATAVTQALSDSSTKIATTAFVKGQGYAVGNIYSTDGSLSGNRTITLNGSYLDIAGTTKTRFFANGNVVIDGASPVDAGFKFDVNGTVRVTSFLTVGSDAASATVIKGPSSDGSIFIGGSSMTTSIAALRNIIVSTVGSYSTLTGINNTFYGRAAGLNVTSGASNVFIGSNAGAGITSGARNVFVTSSDAGNLPSSLSYSIHLVAGNGYKGNDASSIPSGTHAFFGGGFNTGFAVKDFYFGQMPFTADAGGGLVNIVFYAPSGLGTDIGGANFTLAAGRGTGAGTPGDLIFSTSTAGTSGTTTQALTARLRISGGTGFITASSLAGTGSRMVVADSSGVLSTQAIPSVSGYVPTSRTLTINGTSYDLSADRSWTISSGVSALSAGSGINVSGPTGNVTISNTGLLSASAGGGITVNVASGVLTVTNTGVLSASAGSGIAVNVASGILTVTNTGVISASAGAGINVSVVSGILTISNTITNNNQLTNGAGYLTGITSSQVTTALGYTPYNSSNPNGYISSYTETSTLANVTSRGNTTTTSISATNFQNAYQILSLNNIKVPGLYNYDGGISGTQPLGTEWYNVRTIEVGADSRYSQFVMPYNIDRIFYRRKADAGWQSYVELWHSGNLTNLNQLTNGPGYITGYTETDTLASVTGRGASTSTNVSFNGTLTSAGQTILAGAFRFYTGGSDGSTAYGDFRTNPATGNSIISAKSNALYFNYDHGTGGVIFCNGASGIVGTVDASGNANFIGAITQNGNQVLHAGNYNSYSPTLTGGGASGTWGISITGSAGSTNYLSALGDYVFDATINGRSFNRGIQTSFVSASQSYPSYGSVVRIRTYTGVEDGGTAELYFPYNSTYGGSSMRYRMGQYANAGWTNWKTVIDSDNIGSQSVNYASSAGNADTVDGYHASGLLKLNEWNGNLYLHTDGRIYGTIFYDANDSGYYFDGNSGTNLQYLNVNGTWGSSPFGSGHAQLNVTGTYASITQRSTQGAQAYVLHHVDDRYSLYIGRGATNGSDWDWALRAYPKQDGSYVEFRTSARAPIFYDSQDTSFYVDPNSTSVLSYARITNQFYIGNGSQMTMNYDQIWRPDGGQIHIGYSAANNIQLNYGGGYTYSLTSLRAPIFYDYNDTGYYGDFAGTSRLSVLNIVDSQYIGGQTVNGQSHYQWEGATYRNPGQYSAGLIVRRDNATTGLDGSYPALVLYNNDGRDQSTVAMSFATMESNSGGNAVPLGGIIAKKSIAGNNGGWSSGSLTFYVKDLGTRRDSITMHTSGRTSFGTASDAGYMVHVAGDIYANGGWLRVSGGAGLYFESYGGGWRMTGSSYIESYNGKSIHMNSGSIDYTGSIYINSGPGVHLQGNSSGSYGSLQITQSKNGWSGIYFTASENHLMANNNEVGHYQYGIGWKYRWYQGTMYVSRGTYGGSTEYTVLDSGNYTSWAQPYLYKGISTSGDFQTFQSSEGVRFDQVNYTPGLSNPPGGYTYGGVLSMRGNNFGFQLWGSHTGDLFYKTQWSNDQYSGWRQIITSLNIGSQSVSYASTSGNTNSISAAVGGSYTWTNYNYFRTNNGGYLGSLSQAALQVYSDSNNSAYMSFHKGGYYAVNMGLDGDNWFRIGGWSASSNRLQMDMSGNLYMAGDVTAYSDARVKENVVTIDNALNKVQKLRGVYYNRTDSDDKRRKVGVIAQEILEVIPEVVGKDNDGMYNVSYGNIVGVLIEAMKEQQKQIEDLKGQLNGITK